MSTTVQSLLEKYELIRKIRADAAGADGATIQKLARTFPGALRELELLPPDDLASRIDALECGEPPWARPMLRYHQNLKRILAAKKTGSLGDLSAAERNELTKPPDGRVSRLALAWTSEQLGLSPDQLRQLLWPLMK